ALRLGRMRGDHWTHAQPRERLADLTVGDALRRRGSEQAGEGAAQLLVAALALELAAAAHVTVLFGYRQQLEPDSLSLQRARQKGRRHPRRGALLAQHRRDLGLVALHHADEQIEQQRRAGEILRRLAGIHFALASACATVEPSSAG